MAQRRMFSLKIVASDAFLDMPTSSRELYFQLGMYADDDGFINPKKIVRMVGASEDDLKLLEAKRFILPFENGVVVIKHWLINNLIRKDFYQETSYVEEKKSLIIKENKSYTESQQIVNNPSTQVRLGKVRLGKDINTESVVADATPTPSETSQEFFKNPEIIIQELITAGLPEVVVRKEIDKFVFYWTESNKSGTKQRWQLQKTFEVKRRIRTWLANTRDFNNKNKVVNI